MTTIIVHGTLGKGSPWYWNSWTGRGYCRALAGGMSDIGQAHDIWRINGVPISEIPAINRQISWSDNNGTSGTLETFDGRFEWSGAAEGLARGASAVALARYLNAIRELTSEPLRIIAHSHGCNLVKLASSLPELSKNVVIEKAVFLACPHFWEDDYKFPEPKTLSERLDIRKQMTPKKGRKFRYRASPDVFGRILNIYTNSDTVQISIAEKLSGTYVPLTGGFVKNLRKLFGTMDVYEIPHGTRCDEDAAAVSLYENVEVQVSPSCTGIEAHSVLHGEVTGRPTGRWLASDESMETLLGRYGPLESIPCDDLGA